MSNEVFNFRVLRAADRRLADEELWIDLVHEEDFFKAFADTPQSQELLARASSTAHQVQELLLLYENSISAAQRVAGAQQWLTSPNSTVGTNSSMLDPLVVQLDNWLVSKNNRPAGTEFARKLLELVQIINPSAREEREFIARLDFITTYYRLVGTISAGLLVLRDPGLWSYADRQRTIRLFIVMSLVLRWCADKRSVNERREIAEFLRFARIRILDVLLKVIRIQPLMNEQAERFDIQYRLVRRPGFIDHYVVREQWKRYELGELADVNSVMPGESRKRSHVRFNETEEQTLDIRERVEVDERNLQTENRYELSDAAHEAQSAYLSAEGNVENTTITGTNTTVAYIGGQFEFSSEASRDTASKHTRDIVDRASNVVHQRTYAARSTRQLTRITETNEHNFDNSGTGSQPINGIYRWVDKINEVSLYRYPRRYVIEFVLPEPGTWLKWALSNRGRDSRLPEPPPPWPTYLNSADDILSAPGRVGDYLLFAKLLGATDVPTKPENRILGVTLSRDTEDTETLIEVDLNGVPSIGIGTPIKYSTEARISVPNGWRAVRFQVTATSRTRFNNPPNNYPLSGRLWVSVGETKLEFTLDRNSNGGTLSGNLSGITIGQIPVHAADMNCFGFAANIVVECEPTAEAIVQWQQSVFDRFVQTYQRQRANYENAVEALRVAGELDDRSLSPGRVRNLIQSELKRQIITLLDPTAPLGQSSLNLAANGEPSINTQELSAKAAQLLFFEQAFEWSTLSYIFYPYYWARRQVWQESAITETANPEFDQFVQSGSARVVVAARPAFTEQVQFFLEYGVLWGGSGVPAPNDPGYLSVAEEILDLQRGPSDGELVDSWEVRLPTALTALDPTGTFPLINE